MKLTRQRQFSIGVLGLGLAALAVDRLFLGPRDGGPFPALAAQGAPEPAPTVARASLAALGMISVADRLDAAREKGDAPSDGFTPPEGWLPKEPAKKAAAAPAKTQEKEAPVDLQLTAIFPDAQRGAQAIINRTTVREGDEVEGWRVVKILGAGVGERPSVRLELDGRVVVLGIESPMKGKVKAAISRQGEKR